MKKAALNCNIKLWQYHNLFKQIKISVRQMHHSVILVINIRKVIINVCPRHG